MIAWIKRLFRHRHKWRQVRTIWPYPDGWAWHCRGCGTVLPFSADEDKPAS